MLDITGQWEGIHIESANVSLNLGNDSTYFYSFQLNETGLYHITNLNLEQPILDFYLLVREGGGDLTNIIPGYNTIILFLVITASIIYKYHKSRKKVR